MRRASCCSRRGCGRRAAGCWRCAATPTVAASSSGRACDRAREAGLLVDAAAGSMAAAFVELHAGDLEAAERLAREGLPELERLGDRAHHPTLALMLADVLVSSGAPTTRRSSWCRTARETSGPDDLVNFVDLDLIEGFLRAQRGEHDDGEAHGPPRRRTRRDDGLLRRARAWPGVARAHAHAGREEGRGTGGGRARRRDLRGARATCRSPQRARRLLDEVAVSV